MLTLLYVTLGLCALGFLLMRRFRARGEAGLRGGAGTISIIIPARNEERNLPTLLRSLFSQEPRPHEILVVDDGSSDGTATVARQIGATVIVSRPLPEGWRGKPWACHQGAQAATGELFLFLDADTWFEPGGFARALARYERGAFSVGPYHVTRKLYESLSLFFNLCMVVGTVPDRLFGQMLLVDRESYGRVGGHEAVKGRVLENVYLASRCRAAGVPVQSLPGRGDLSFRMYPNGLCELIEGWTKGFASGAGQTPQGTLILIIAWMTGLMLAPLGWLATGDWLRWGGTYFLCVAQVSWLSRRVGAFRWPAAWLYPFPLLFFFAVFARAAMRSGKVVRWKGREIHAD